MQGLTAAIWLLGLFAAAGVLRAPDWTGRLRDALVLGVAIPLVLGALHVLYPIALWLALAAVLATALRHPEPSAAKSRKSLNVTPAIPYVTLAAIALVAWPQLMRPPLDGDTLSYHLPNAAAWVHAHSLATTDPRYWWYPPASELFGCALFAVAGPFAAGWSGVAAMALLGTRIAMWARTEFAAPPLLADALAAATVTIGPLALQAGTMQNDVWLAAFLLEALWALRAAPAAVSIRTLAVLTLLKPYGWAMAAIAAASSRAPLRVWIVVPVAAGAWTLHVALLWHHAIVSPASASTANSWGTSILAHGLSGVALLARVLLPASPFGLIAFGAAILGPLVARSPRRGLGWAALGAAAVFLVMPLAYADWHPQLATGASLRYAAPAFAIGALLLARPCSRVWATATLALLASTVFGAVSTLLVFWNDAPTRSAIAVAAIAAATFYAAQRRRHAWPVAAGFAAAVIVAVPLAARHPVDYYADALAVNGVRPGVYAWVAETQPAAIGGWGLRLGTVNVLSPQARTVDLPEEGACAAARALGVTLVAVAERDRDAAFNAARLARARTCGTAAFDDALAAVRNP